MRKPRLIQFRGRGATGFRGVFIGPMDSLWAPSTLEDVMVAVVGDSFSEGIGLASPFDPDASYPHVLGHLLGWADVRQVAVGATGYLANGSGQSLKIRDQIANWGITPDVIVCAAGYNDQGSGFTAGATADEAALAWAAMRAAAPRAKIFVVGPWIGRRTAAVMQPYETALQSAFTTWADRNAHFIPLSNTSPVYTTGTGYVGATTGAGNSDIYVSSDGLHLNDAGYAYHAHRLAADIRKAIKT